MFKSTKLASKDHMNKKRLSMNKKSMKIKKITSFNPDPDDEESDDEQMGVAPSKGEFNKLLEGASKSVDNKKKKFGMKSSSSKAKLFTKQ